jgi:transcription elongation factor GreA
VRDDRRDEVAGRVVERAEQQAGAEGEDGPDAEIAPRREVRRREEQARDHEPDLGLERAPEERLLADPAHDREHHALAYGERPERGAERAGERAAHLGPRREDRRECDHERRGDRAEERIAEAVDRAVGLGPEQRATADRDAPEPGGSEEHPVEDQRGPDPGAARRRRGRRAQGFSFVDMRRGTRVGCAKRSGSLPEGTGPFRSRASATEAHSRLAMAERVPMRPSGYAMLEAELKRLKSVDRHRIVKEIEVARAHGDISENAEFEAAKERQAQIEGRIRMLEDRLARAQVIDGKGQSPDAVRFGATVELMDTENGDQVTYTIVGEDESDAARGLISVTSPIARALLGKPVDEVVAVQVPRGRREFEIRDIRFD